MHVKFNVFVFFQAAVLCQCLDDVDYSTAFRCLAETKNLLCADAMDSYYPCIWDLTLLEYLVNMHSKRGEAQRKQQVVSVPYFILLWVKKCLAD